MKHKIAIFMLCLPAFLLMLPVAYSKPLPSISIKATWQGELVQEMPMTLTVSVFSQVSSEALEIILTLPDGVILLDGLLKEVTAVDRSEPIERQYSVQISKGAVGYVKAEARVNNTGHTYFYAASQVPVSLDETVKQKLSPRANIQESFKRTQRNGGNDGNGEWLREYRLR